MILNELTYVSKAEGVIKALKKESTKPDRYGNEKVTWITTSKVRNIMSMAADIFNEVSICENDLPESVKSRILYLRVRCFYEAGRDEKGVDVKPFLIKAQIMDILNEIETKKDYVTFYHYMEALVAFHKFYGGKD